MLSSTPPSLKVPSGGSDVRFLGLFRSFLGFLGPKDPPEVMVVVVVVVVVPRGDPDAIRRHPTLSDAIGR